MTQAAAVCDWRGLSNLSVCVNVCFACCVCEDVFVHSCVHSVRCTVVRMRGAASRAASTTCHRSGGGFGVASGVGGDRGRRVRRRCARVGSSSSSSRSCGRHNSRSSQCKCLCSCDLRQDGLVCTSSSSRCCCRTRCSCSCSGSGGGCGGGGFVVGASSDPNIRSMQLAAVVSRCRSQLRLQLGDHRRLLSDGPAQPGRLCVRLPPAPDQRRLQRRHLPPERLNGRQPRGAAALGALPVLALALLRLAQALRLFQACGAAAAALGVLLVLAVVVEQEWHGALVGLEGALCGVGGVRGRMGRRASQHPCRRLGGRPTPNVTPSHPALKATHLGASCGRRLISALALAVFGHPLHRSRDGSAAGGALAPRQGARGGMSTL